MCVNACGDLELTLEATIFRSSTPFLKAESPSQPQSLPGRLVSLANLFWGSPSPPSEARIAVGPLRLADPCLGGFLGSDLWPSEFHCKRFNPRGISSRPYSVSLKRFIHITFIYVLCVCLHEFMCTICVRVPAEARRCQAVVSRPVSSAKNPGPFPQQRTLLIGVLCLHSPPPSILRQGLSMASSLLRLGHLPPTALPSLRNLHVSVPTLAL